jgi:hypothetical protein
MMILLRSLDSFVVLANTSLLMPVSMITVWTHATGRLYPLVPGITVLPYELKRTA